MEYKDYIDDVKKLIKNMSEQEKTDWIYNYARTCNKSNWLFNLTKMNLINLLMK